MPLFMDCVCGVFTDATDDRSDVSHVPTTSSAKLYLPINAPFISTVAYTPIMLDEHNCTNREFRLVHRKAKVAQNW
jgi:hypothetical protein